MKVYINEYDDLTFCVTSRIYIAYSIVLHTATCNPLVGHRINLETQVSMKKKIEQKISE